MGKNSKIEDQRTFTDLTNKSWFIDGKNIKVGESFQKIMSGEFSLLDFKEILTGEQVQTWKIVITNDDKFYLLKKSRELK
jgi:hypothetical protein